MVATVHLHSISYVLKYFKTYLAGQSVTEKVSPDAVNINKPYALEHFSTFQVAKNSIVQSFVYNLHFNSDCMINFSRTILQVKVDSNHLTSSQESLINLVALPIE